MSIREPLVTDIEAVGMLVLGAFEPVATDGLAAMSVAVVGSVGELFWRSFLASAEAVDGAPDPLDRWTRRTVGEIAARYGHEALYPFGGPPHHPFQQWAMRADSSLRPSPLGLLIHPRYGLWLGLRAAILLKRPIETGAPAGPRSAGGDHPCETCVGRPCLSACPVGAFEGQGYDVAACRDHLRGSNGGDCVTGGCLARRACPLATSLEQDSEQARFHMRAFMGGNVRAD